jgi:hypothetical protein
MENDKKQDADPGIKSVYEYLTYGLSLPERALRSTSAMVGGVLRESASLLIPQAFQDSKSYQMFVSQMLDFVANDVGGVKSDKPNATEVDGYVAKKAVSNFVELAGMATLHVSPMTILAITSDLAFGSTHMLKELSAELKKQGVIAEQSTIDSTADFLEAISETSGDAANAFDLPPLSVEGLQDTIAKTQEKLNRLGPTQMLPQAEMQRMWNDIYDMAAKENVDVFEVSSAMTMYSMNQLGAVAQGALTTIRVTGNMIDKHIFEHYWTALEDISDQGLYTFVGKVSGPYIEAVWDNFSIEKATLTQDLLNGKLAGKAWDGIHGWFQGTKPEDLDASAEDGNSENG